MTIPTIRAFMSCLGLLVCHLTSAQDLRNTALTSEFAIVYAISNDEARELLKHPGRLPDTSYFHTETARVNVEDSLQTYPWKPGHWLVTHIVRGEFQCWLHSENTVLADVYENSRDLAIDVYAQSSGKRIANAQVVVGNKRIPYNAATQHYELPKSHRQGLLEVRVGDEIAFYQLTRSGRHSFLNRVGRRLLWGRPMGWVTRPVWRFGRRLVRWNWYGFFERRYLHRASRYSGYLTSSKPMYLPGDTLKLKAFVLNKRQRPYRKPLVLSVYPGYRSSRTVHTDTLPPVADGAYEYSWILPDTLTIDRDYTLLLEHPRSGRELVENTFTLADYQLDEVDFKLTTNQTQLERGDTLRITMNALDANMLPVLDGRVDLRLTLTSLSKGHQQQVIVPQLLWRHTGELDRDGETELLVPQAV